MRQTIGLLFGLALLAAIPSVAEEYRFDGERAIERYWDEFEECKTRGGSNDYPSCKAMVIYADALEENGYCGSGVGVSFKWIRCE